jgi:ABC-type uncharacterized transport system permease subunit
MGTSELIGIIVGIGILIGLFLLLRNVSLWYFKINEIVELLTQIRNNLRELNAKGKDIGSKD